MLKRLRGMFIEDDPKSEEISQIQQIEKDNKPVIKNPQEFSGNLNEFFQILNSLESVIPDNFLRIKSTLKILNDKNISTKSIIEEIMNILNIKNQENEVRIENIINIMKSKISPIEKSINDIEKEVKELEDKLVELHNKRDRLVDEKNTITSDYDKEHEMITSIHDQEIKDLNDCLQLIKTAGGE